MYQPKISLSPPSEPRLRRSLRVMQMVHELHKAGCQLLRIIPNSSDGFENWQLVITLAGNVNPEQRVIARHDVKFCGDDLFWATYSMKDDDKYFGWRDAAGNSARELAAKFIERFPRLANDSQGVDWPYVGWYVDLLGRCEQGDLPICNFPFPQDPEEPPNFPTREFPDGSDLPLPPRPPRG